MKHTYKWLMLNRRLFRICESLCDTLKPRVDGDSFASICHIFLSRSARTLRGITVLYENKLDECGQALVRTLFENRVNFDWFVRLAEADRADAVRRYLDGMYLQWVKQANDFHYHGVPGAGDSALSISEQQNEAQIRARYSEDEFKSIRKEGFSSLSIEERAKKLGYSQLYCVVFRSFARNVHGTDFAERLAVLRETDLGDFPERIENLSLCTAQFSAHGIAEKIDSLFSLGTSDKLKNFKAQHDRLARDEKLIV